MKPAPQLRSQKTDIQAVLGSGFGWLPSSRFLLLTIRDVTLAKAWLVALEQSGWVKSIADVALERSAGRKPTGLAAIAFSFAGLTRLGLVESGEFPFPTAFRSGMGSDLRKDLLRDGPRDKWLWSDHEADPRLDCAPAAAHVLLASWWNTSSPPALPDPAPGAFSVREIAGCPSFFEGEALYEPFRFRDGISQPAIYGLNEELDAKADKVPRDQVVAAGEFILGYRNEYDELSYCPEVHGWKASGPDAHPEAHFTLNGSYLAVRQIDQDLEALAELEQIAVQAPCCPSGVSLAEKMMGRRRDGTPLSMAPVQSPLTDEKANNFRYRVEDANGFMTPRGSHIRRANPRDSLGHDVESGITSSKLHRLLRRGRPYRGMDANGKPAVGTFFIACNTDLERQFEFVQQRWLRNPRFADLDSEDDPLVGATSTEKKFSIQGLPTGHCVSFRSLTTTLGGGYFFLPGLKALRFIAGCAAPQATGST